MSQKSTPSYNATNNQEAPRVLTIRALSGLSGDMMVAGLARMNSLTQEELNAYTHELGMPNVNNCAHLIPKSVHHISGWHCDVQLPHEHAHRTCNDIINLIQASTMQEQAKKLAEQTFVLLAKAEGSVHGITPEKVTFHEVGALDSIVDICLACSLFVRLAPDVFQVSPLPLADGAIMCAHGIIPCPAPAVLALLADVAVCSFKGHGETVTPTAIALIKTFGAVFGPWPNMCIEKTDIVYGTKIFSDAPNGSLWALGREISTHESLHSSHWDNKLNTHAHEHHEPTHKVEHTPRHHEHTSIAPHTHEHTHGHHKDSEYNACPSEVHTHQEHSCCCSSQKPKANTSPKQSNAKHRKYSDHSS